MRAPRVGPVLFLLALTPLPAQQAPDLRERIELFSADVGDLERRYDVPMSGERRRRLRERFEREQHELAEIDFDTLPRDARVDWLLLDNHVRRELHALDEEARRDEEVRDLVPFAATIVGLGEARRRLEPVEPEGAADTMAALAVAVEDVRTRLRKREFEQIALPVAARAAEVMGELRRALRGWFEYRVGYDPLFSWWVRAPYEAADKALGALQQELRDRNDKLAGDSSLVGDPIGQAALLRELAFEWIPYSPTDLIEIAEREFAWCDAEMDKAAHEMGCGADWRLALRKVKQQHVAPGAQPQLIADLAREAIAFLEQRDLITIPDLAKECWRMRMMSPAAQRVNPFFLGGETIQVSFPTDAMAHEDKLQSLRSNNEHFCRATVFHELIPGHWLQQYSQERYRRYRAPFGTPFWIEGWALYWEMRMYELGLPKGPEDRVGMLYWRKHRCARIVFSLHFQLGEWTGPQCVDYLIERVGHERAAAEGEVRRSVSGGYGPLYQAAYMLGGLQLRALHGDLVGPGRRSEKAFHDDVLRQNSIPIAVLRAALGPDLPPRELPAWRFADR
ncbi:MAG TPA: DUF885 family protein [Planctomycetota bacterium]|nr:DUF885 family protein [Planctomycetota bacterium]